MLRSTHDHLGVPLRSVLECFQSAEQMAVAGVQHPPWVILHDPGVLPGGEKGGGVGRDKKRLPLYDFLSICPTFLHFLGRFP